MPAQRFDVVLLGEVTPGIEPLRVHRRLAKRFRRDPDFMADLLGRGSVAIKKNVDFATAVRYRDAVRADGAECKIVERRPAPGQAPQGVEKPQDDRAQAERERAARERVSREMAGPEESARDEAARKKQAQAARRQARAAAEREQAEREQAEREQAAREQAAQEKIAREKKEREARRQAQAVAEREKAQREQAVREQAAVEKKEQAARRQAQARAAQEEAGREQAAQAKAAHEQPAAPRREAGRDTHAQDDAPGRAQSAQGQGEQAPQTPRRARRPVEGQPPEPAPLPPEPAPLPHEPASTAEVALLTEPELASAAALLDKTPAAGARRNCRACGFGMPASEPRCPRCGVPVRARGGGIRWRFALAIGAAAVLVVAVAAFLYFPQYRESVWQEKIAAAEPFIREAQAMVGEFIANNGVYPRSNEQAGLPFRLGNDLVASVKLADDASMQIVYAPIGPAAEVWTQAYAPVEIGGEVVWVCTGGSLPDRFKSPDCLAGAAARVLRTAEKTLRADPAGVVLKVPRAWRRLEEMEGDALLGAGDPQEELYVIVVDKRIESFRDIMTLDQYTADAREQLRANLDEGDWESLPAPLTVNALDARRGILRGDIDGIESTYLVTLLRREDRFFQVIAWTLSEQFAQQRAVLTRVSDSFEISAK